MGNSPMRLAAQTRNSLHSNCAGFILGKPSMFDLEKNSSQANSILSGKTA
jgi:hypothetical protein